VKINVKQTLRSLVHFICAFVVLLLGGEYMQKRKRQ